ncbi:MAG: phosphate acetyltransferase [Mycoplasmataceae bacterium]|nr:phosphate acetyltransferase [Mycoplasmataceae bacterium]
MNKIEFRKIKEELRNSQKIIILSTDNDERFEQAKEILKIQLPNIEYIKIDQKYIDDFDQSEKKSLFATYIELRQGKESLSQLETNFNNPNYFANLLVFANKADGIVSGSTHKTSDILRPAFQIIKPRIASQVISSFMWLCKEEHRDLFMADISIMPNPDASQLAQIAIATANSVKTLFNIEPFVAMLSFSTLGSGGKNESVLKVAKATEIVRDYGINVVGEIQWDAAYFEDVFITKTKTKPQQLPNIFIFPDLNSGNIGYKIAASLGKFKAIGPLLQNINKPINDLSRGATSQEIADLVVITALQVIRTR